MKDKDIVLVKKGFYDTQVSVSQVGEFWIYAIHICADSHYYGYGFSAASEKYADRQSAVSAGLNEIIKTAKRWIKNFPTNIEKRDCEIIIQSATDLLNPKLF
jgi:uncharacterized protein (DUF169 family)